jgi:predicted DNA-binding transcriptional regulator AlpA
MSEQFRPDKSQPSSAARLATKKPWEACGISRSQWYKLKASGRTPLPVRLGTRRPVYLITELQSWLAAGAPDRQTWERMRGGQR